MSPLRLSGKQDDVVYNSYLQKYQSIKDEIHALRSKISIILGFLGIIGSILISNIITRSYSFNNIISVVTEIMGHHPVQEHVFDNFQLVQVQDIFVTIIVYIVLFVILTISVDYLFLFLNIHQRPKMTFPDDDSLVELEKVGNGRNSRLILLRNIKETVSNLDCDYEYYSKYLSRLDRNFLLSVLMCIVLLAIYVFSEDLLVFFIDSDLKNYFIVILICFSVYLFIQTILYIYLQRIHHTTDSRKWINDNSGMINQTITKISLFLILGIYLSVLFSVLIVLFGYFFSFQPFTTFIFSCAFIVIVPLFCIILYVIYSNKKVGKPIIELDDKKKLVLGIYFCVVVGCILSIQPLASFIFVCIIIVIVPLYCIVSSWMYFNKKIRSPIKELDSKKN